MNLALPSGHSVPIVLQSSATIALTVPVARTQLHSNPIHSVILDFTGCTRFRIQESHGSGTVAGCKFLLAATTDLTGAAGWTDLDGTSQAGAPAAYVDITTAAVLNVSAEFVLATALRGLVRVRGEIVDGNGSTSYNTRTFGGVAY